MILFFYCSNLRRRLPFCWVVLRFRTTAPQRSESTFACRGKVKNSDRFKGLTCAGASPRHFCWSRLHLSCLFNARSTAISQWFSYHLDGSSFWVKTFLDLDTRFLECTRVQSRFRDTRNMPYGYWGSECQSERAPVWRENAFWCCVMDRTGREREWMKKFEKGRKPTKGRSETNWNFQSVHERQRWRYEQTKKGKECDQMFTTETLGVVNFLRKNDSSSEFWGGDYHFVREFFIFKPAIKKSSQRLIRNWRETDRILVNRRQMREMKQQQDSYTTRNQGWLRLSSLLLTIEGFWWM